MFLEKNERRISSKLRWKKNVATKSESFEGFVADENVVDWLYLVSKYPRRASLPLIFTYLEKNIDDKILEHIENHCDNLSSIKIMKRS